ncbi:G2 M phase-specific E3 ubiquitin- ligase-like [Paramuricea clavata]|uniref:G2 M phase-specific E3 ubiquitin- ligase-like n=1 Tax=Paramuricea clavata TaxID=317549 RepID=A0A6S7JTI4_PARCT|nr:G2 M phase-specific E3 ubiquitin- ligase-like [Paramuricea clavata]
MIKQNKDAMKYLFTMSDTFVPSVDYMLDHIHGEFSEEGSNMKTNEIDIYKYLNDYIEDIGFSASPDDGTDIENTATTLSKLYRFITGTSTVPPCGLPKDITVKFKHDCDDKCRCRPTASTCNISFTLPLHYANYLDFKECVSSALVETYGFGFL